MLKTSVVTIASLLLAYPIVGAAINLGLPISNPFAILGALFATATLNAYLLCKLVS